MASGPIFLSYTADEGPFVRSVAAELRRRGIDLSEGSDADVGSRWSEQLQDTMRSASIVVVFLGRAIDSPWINFEIGAAIGQSKIVLPVFLSHDAQDAGVARHFSGIDASNLKPVEVADQISAVLGVAA